ncbi:hypothetical protein JTB14_023193 [Gonioctena quinquepunctata]|nr:hypothetical protein JTB14_023193 [Gonioctena quinquepunctata]
MIIMGDFNGNHRAWGSSTNNINGTNIFQTLERLELVYSNDGSPTRINSPDQGTSVVSNNIDAISSWTTIPDLGFSDHFPTMCSIWLGLGDVPPSNERRNYSKVDWEKYNSILDLSFSSFPTGNKYDYFEKSLKTAAKSSIPLYKPTSKSKYHIPWWDDSCSDITKKRIEAIRQFKIDPSWNNYLIVKKQCAAARKFLKIKIKNNFKEFCSKINRNSPTKVVWDIIRKISGQKASLQLSMPQANVAQEILNSLAPRIFTNSNINSNNGPTSSNITPISYS